MLGENLLLLVIVIPLMGFLLYAGLQSFRLFFNYEITDKNIVVYLFRVFPIYRIPFEKIVKIYSAPFHEVAIVPGVHLFTRPFAKRVVIEMRERWFIFAFLTPEDTEGFIQKVKSKMPK